MKKILILTLILFISYPSLAQQWVSGYYKKNGTYVQPYRRSHPDGNLYNNYKPQRSYNQVPVYSPPVQKRNSVNTAPLGGTGRPNYNYLKR